MIFVVNGPNLNLLGKREPMVYGFENLTDLENRLKSEFPSVEFTFFQSNIEGEIIDFLQQTTNSNNIGIVLNAGAYSHTSIAIADTIKAISTKVIAVHISNVFNREIERKTDLIAANCAGYICGLGLDVYALAVQGLLLKQNK